MNEVSIVAVPAFNFPIIDGEGDPNDNPRMRVVFEALHAVSHTLRFVYKPGRLGKARDCGVNPPGGLRWADDMSQFSRQGKYDWTWTP